MINFSVVKIKRVIMHQINQMQKNADCATVEYEKSLVEINDNVTKTLLERLTNASGKESKSFQLDIEEYDKGTFFDLASQLKGCNDQIFIDSSADIADLLAESQTSRNIPGGFLLVIECENNDGKSVVIVIKAELQEVLTKKVKDGQTTIEVLNNVFLSPASKLFKIGILEEKNDGEFENPNRKYNCYLYDEQFRSNGTPAEYFYERFLGFSISNNAKIQSKKFYEYTTDFIKRYVGNPTRKSELLKHVNQLFTVDLHKAINPREFSNTVFRDGELKDAYFANVVSILPSTIAKDRTLIESKLNNKRIDFYNNIKITGPNDIFDDKVKVLYSREELGELNLEGNYTILVVAGAPYSVDE